MDRKNTLLLMISKTCKAEIGCFNSKYSKLKANIPAFIFLNINRYFVVKTIHLKIQFFKRFNCGPFCCISS